MQSRVLERFVPSDRHNGLTVMTVTPALAEKFLSGGARNRAISEKTVNDYATALKSGEWQLNGETIKFDINGRLLDGQHRLLAVVRSGVALRTYVISGLPPENQDTVDIGRRRGVGDVAQIHGFENGKALTAAARWCILLNREVVGDKDRNNVSAKEILAFVENNPDLSQSIKVGSGGTNAGRWLSPSLASALHFLFAKRNKAVADLFFHRLSTGIGISDSGDPVGRLIHALQVNQSKPSTRRDPRIELAAKAVRAWNYFIRNEKINCLKGMTLSFKDGEEKRTLLFPPIQG